MAHLLVTGGAGFLGSHTVDVALSRGHRVTVLDLLTYAGDRARVAPEAGFVHGDVADPRAVAAAIDGVDGVLHLAAETHVDRSIDGPAIFVHTNVLGTQVVLDAVRARGLRLLHVSTDEVYGDRDGLDAADEDSAFRPSSPYAAAKAGADHLVAAAVRTWGVDAVVVRPCNAYGARQHAEKLLPTLLRCRREGRPLPLYGDGLQVRDWAPAEALADAFVRVWESGHGVYNLAGHDAHTNRTLAARVGGPIVAVADRPGHDRRYAMTDTRARAEGFGVRGDVLGWLDAQANR